jgi:hypothetical protein
MKIELLKNDYHYLSTKQYIQYQHIEELTYVSYHHSHDAAKTR